MVEESRNQSSKDNGTDCSGRDRSRKRDLCSGLEDGCIVCSSGRSCKSAHKRRRNPGSRGGRKPEQTCFLMEQNNFAQPGIMPGFFWRNMEIKGLTFPPGRKTSTGKQSRITVWGLLFSGSQKSGTLQIIILKKIMQRARNITFQQEYINTLMQ